MAQGQDLFHPRRVVLFGFAVLHRFRLVGGACGVSAVKLFAQGRAVRKLHDGQVARHFQIQLVTHHAIFFSCSARGLQHIIGHACQFFAGHDGRPLVGGIEHVFAEFLAHLGLALLNSRKALFGSTHQLSTRQHKVAHGQGVGVFLFRIQTGHVNGFVLRVQAFVGTEACVELGHARQCFGVGCTQFRRVGHRMQVAHGAPSTAEFFGGHIKHAGNGFPIGGEVGGGDFL